jgi:hypothetical protein
MLPCVGDERGWPDFEVNAGGGELGHQQVQRRRVSSRSGAAQVTARAAACANRRGAGLGF